MTPSSPQRSLHWQAELIAFDGETARQPFSVSARGRWSQGSLSLHYTLQGPLERLVLPLASAERGQGEGQRRDGLWQSTCLEAFLAVPGRSDYWELNLNPAGDWNVYRLDAYRTGLRPESRLPRLERAISLNDARLEVAVTLPLATCIGAAEPLELSATAVLEHRDGGCSYWAWRHCGDQADFHRRDSLVAGDWISAG